MNKKEKLAKEEEQFTVFPKLIIDHINLKPAETTVLLVLTSYDYFEKGTTQKKGFVFPGIRTIIKKAGINKDKYSEVIFILEQTGIVLKATRKSKKRTIIYMLPNIHESDVCEINKKIKEARKHYKEIKNEKKIKKAIAQSRKKIKLVVTN